MNVSIKAFQPATQHKVPTKAHTKADDQLGEAFDLWVRNNVGEQEFNIGKTHPEATEVAMQMVKAASEEVGGEGAFALPGSKIEVPGAKEGQFAVGLHPVSFSGNGIVGPEPIAILFVDTTPGQDGALFGVTKPGA